MPFTPAHVVAVLPLVSGRRARHFDAAALSIGAMVPDLPYFVPPYAGSRWTHAWFGPVTIDLVLGLAVLAVWRWASPPLVDLAPGWLRSRLSFPASRVRQRWLVAAWSVALGAATHVLWDTFSHAHRWGTDHVAWLVESHGPLLGYKWVQYGSGAGGLLVLGIWLLVWVRRTPRRPVPYASTRLGRHRRPVRVLVAALLVLTVAATWVRGAVASGRWLDETTAVDVATSTIGVGLLLVLVLRWAGGAAVPVGDQT